MFDLFVHQQKFAGAMKNDASKAGISKIFRPWDMSENGAKISIGRQDVTARFEDQQDCTISTTTDMETEENESGSKSAVFLKENVKHKEKESNTCTSEDSNTSLLTETSNANKSQLLNHQINSSVSPTFYQDFPSIYFPTCTNLDDPFLLESLSQHGYALEDYARVMSQEHQAKLLSSRKQRPKKYRCPHCDVGFSNNGQLKGHIRIHTGERPFKCEESNCGKTFTRNEELTRHKRIHSGLRPFPCTQCGKRFGRKDHLKKHSRTHMQPRGGLYAVPIMLPLDTWTAAMSGMYPYPGQRPFAY